MTTPTPMPDTQHPAVDEPTARFLLGWMESGQRAPAITMHLDPMVAFRGYDPAPAPVRHERRVWAIHRCAGPMPFVGDPLTERSWYEWDVATWTDEHVAGPTRMKGDAWLRWGIATQPVAR